VKNVLVVDNSSFILNVLKNIFAEKNNFNVFLANTYEEAIKLLEEKDFFMAISNLVLPNALNGEMVNKLSEYNIPTVVLSSKIDNKFMNDIESFNVVDYVLKDSMHGLENVHNLVELLSFIKDMDVLVVEDSNSFAYKIKDVLETLMLKVKVVSNGKEALEVLENNDKISMVITDYNMPEMNGLELTRIIRKDKSHVNTPIVIMSAEEDKEFRIRLFKNGVNDFLAKPVLKEELKSKVLDIFANIKQLNEINSFNKIFDENIISSSTNEKGVIKSVSKAFCEISGYTKEELIGKHHNIVRHPDMPKSIYEELWSTIQSGKCWKGEIKNLRKDGSYYWVNAIIEPEFDRNGEIVGYYAVRQDITDKKRIYELSITDGLTSLYNRRYFNEVAKDALEKHVRTSNIFAFALLDIDNFKKYNDTYGHQEGDSVLINVSNSLKDSFQRSDDLVFRLGGEEFGILMKTKTVEDAILMTENARQNIQALAIKHEKNPPQCVTASFGLVIISSFEDNDYTIDSIYKRADDCLYEAKESGRNTVEYINL